MKGVFDHIATLSRLGPYAPDVKKKLEEDFERILGLFGVLEKLAQTPAREELSQELAINATREDRAQVFAGREKIIQNFPERQANLLKVPKVIE